jgi:hypothetical protein
MSNDLIVLPFAHDPQSRKNIPQSIRALRAAPPGSLNPRTGLLARIALSEVGCESKNSDPSDEITGMLHLEHGRAAGLRGSLPAILDSSLDPVARWTSPIAAVPSL